MSVQSKRTSPHAGDYPDPPTGPWVWVRALGTVVAALSAIANFLWLPNYPVSSIMRGTLAAVAPIVGSARVVSAAGKTVRALGLAEAIEESE
jgi:hypothetical protein